MPVIHGHEQDIVSVPPPNPWIFHQHGKPTPQGSILRVSARLAFQPRRLQLRNERLFVSHASIRRAHELGPVRIRTGRRPVRNR